uniref:Alpha-1,4 glucan phosphorylase n=1 Tax=uncultured Bacillota bacterium TaxID=344338 RepID=A0A650F4K7_9FIRM|nr:alpha-1,4 glucan phosphorylase [uncultured Firmicutes bacterium]
MEQLKKGSAEFEKQKEYIKDEISGKLKRYFGKTTENATPSEIYKACASAVRDQIMEKWTQSNSERAKGTPKELYYLSFEFLMGRALGNNLMNILQSEVYEEALKDFGLSLFEIEERENDAGLGNGGLGRLAACFLDSLSTLELPAYGCGIRYEYGLFKQKIVDGYQIELPDPWLEDGNAWEIARPDEQFEVHFNGRVEEYWDNGRMKFHHVDYNTVIGEPYDMPISGYNSDTVNTLRLWRAKSPTPIDMTEFNRGAYTKAMDDKELAEVVSKVLYPEDNHYEGKMLRLKQQYFFVSATIQWILSKHQSKHLSLFDLPDYVQIHINDTHPTIAIAELMRLLVDQENMEWDDAWSIVTRTFAYTNHTIMSEALERWPVSMFETLMPRVYQIVKEIDRRQREALHERFGNDQGKIEYMAVISNGMVNMANLCLTACHSVNGVAALHTEILKKETFHDYYTIYPYKFKNMTNGVTQRRWLKLANPALADLISSSIGDEWLTKPDTLNNLLPFADDAAFRQQFARIKLENKKLLADYIQRNNGITVDPESLFDVQIKRLHEYKRQLLKLFHIIYRYQKLTDAPEQADRTPETFIFGAKASPGYHTAKLIIKLINSVAEVVNNDPRTKDILRVVFIENYGVSIAEKIVAAANISEQISTASKEASGTGNMKMMLNGALTVGTLDGANVEIADLVGPENIFIFGLTSEEVLSIYRSGESGSDKLYAQNSVIKKVVDSLIDGTFSKDHENLFYDLYQALVFSKNGFADQYLLLRDFEDYIRVSHQAQTAFASPDEWNRKAIINVAKAGYFSSDRTIAEYNRQIWKLK